jgi:HEPN domain-containing protein
VLERGKSREEWQQLCHVRIEDADALFRNGRYDAAYYLAGYAVECAFKARIVTLLEGYFSPAAKYVRENLYIHSLVKLLESAELNIVLESEPIGTHWGIVKEWKETSRYDFPVQTRESSERMLESVRKVVDCIKQYWETRL